MGRSTEEPVSTTPREGSNRACNSVCALCGTSVLGSRDALCPPAMDSERSPMYWVLVGHSVRNSRRVASASIAGHTFGFVCIAHQLLDLSADDYLVVEGNEDLDIVNGRSPPTHTEIQYKRHGGTFGPANRILYESLSRFLEAWDAHQTLGEGFSGVLWTTAKFAEQRRSSLGAWLLGESPDPVRLQEQVDLAPVSTGHLSQGVHDVESSTNPARRSRQTTAIHG